jgi:deazaflavin-dependent oxidoreductase (nitroreductase family)
VTSLLDGLVIRSGAVMSSPNPVAASVHVPNFVNRLNPLLVRALRLGLPAGPNVLMTVRGRRTGQPRTFPVAVLETGGRRYLFSAFGEVAWVQNLRASGIATVGHGRRQQAVEATELSPDAAAPVLEAGLRPILRVPILGPMIAGWYGIDRDSTAADYRVAARRHPAFELRDLA